MNRRLVVFAAIACVFSFTISTWAQIEIVDVRAEGRGNTRQAAIDNALAEAVTQVNGLALSANREYKLESVEAIASAGDSETKSSAVSESYQAKQKGQLEGVVRSYSIDSCGEDLDGHFVVQITAQIARYRESSNSSKRRRIAMLPFSVADEYFMIGGRRFDSQTVANGIQASLNKYFTQSRRFLVISRKDDQLIDMEKKRIRDNCAPAEFARIGKELGLDYFISGSIRNLFIAPPKEETLVTGAAVRTISRAFIDVEFRIISLVTGQIKWADTITIALDGDQINQVGLDVLALYNYLIEGVSREITARALENIYPIHIASLLPTGECVLNEGGSMVQPNMCYDAFLLGDMIVDPISGEKLGFSESLLTTVVIIRSDAKLAYAKPLAGKPIITADHVKAGVLLRPYRQRVNAAGMPPPAGFRPKAPSASTEANVQIKENGGVVLPFD